jgi:hypothetical protein
VPELVPYAPPSVAHTAPATSYPGHRHPPQWVMARLAIEALAVLRPDRQLRRAALAPQGLAQLTFLDPTRCGAAPGQCSPCTPQRGVRSPNRPVYRQANACRIHRPLRVATLRPLPARPYRWLRSHSRCMTYAASLYWPTFLTQTRLLQRFAVAHLFSACGPMVELTACTREGARIRVAVPRGRGGHP